MEWQARIYMEEWASLYAEGKISPPLWALVALAYLEVLSDVLWILPKVSAQGKTEPSRITLDNILSRQCLPQFSLLVDGSCHHSRSSAWIGALQQSKILTCGLCPLLLTIPLLNYYSHGTRYFNWWLLGVFGSIPKLLSSLSSPVAAAIGRKCPSSCFSSIPGAAPTNPLNTPSCRRALWGYLTWQNAAREETATEHYLYICYR